MVRTLSTSSSRHRGTTGTLVFSPCEECSIIDCCVWCRQMSVALSYSKFQFLTVDRSVSVGGLTANNALVQPLVTLQPLGNLSSVDLCHGACDPASACTQTQTTFTCGPCPVGYVGNPYTQCTGVFCFLICCVVFVFALCPQANRLVFCV